MKNTSGNTRLFLLMAIWIVGLMIAIPLSHGQTCPQGMNAIPQFQFGLWNGTIIQNACVDYSTGDMLFPGAVNYTGTTIRTYTGGFNNAAYYLANETRVGTCTFSSLYNSINGGNETSALSVCATNPSGSTQRQVDGIASMVSSYAGLTSPTVALTGGAVAVSDHARLWAMNLLASDNGYIGDNVQISESNLSINNIGSFAYGHIIVLEATAQPAGGAAFLGQVDVGAGTYFWPAVFKCDTAATTTVSSSTGCLVMLPIASSANQYSQGMAMVSNDPVSGQHAANISLNPSGEMELANSVAGKGMAADAYRSYGTAFASLPTASNGTMIYCPDCTFANPCAGGGTGAIAKRLNGTWRCD